MNRATNKSEGRLVLVAVCLACMVSGCSPTPNPIPVGTDTIFYGNIRNGEKFGIHVGEGRAAAMSVLDKHGLRYDGQFGCNYTVQALFACKSGIHASFRVDEIARHGEVYIEIKNDKVLSIGWELSMLPYIDF